MKKSRKVGIALAASAAAGVVALIFKKAATNRNKQNNENQKALVYGAGVIGSFFAHILCEAGNEVTVLAKGRRMGQLSREGLVTQDCFSKKTHYDSPNIIGEIPEGASYDAEIPHALHLHSRVPSWDACLAERSPASEETSRRSEERAGAGKDDLPEIRAVAGTNSWGSRLYAKVLRGNYVDKVVLKQTVDTAIDMGVTVFDTAQDYGLGKGQPLIGELCGSGISISAKFTPMNDRYKKGQVRASLARDLREMKRDHVDIYWLHLPNSVEENLGEMVELYREGKVNNIGVSNFNMGETKRAKAFLEAEGVPLYGVQNHYSLLAREWEDNGLVSWCRDNGVSFWAWAVLEEGLLAGPRKQKGAMDLAFAAKARKLEPLYREMRGVGDAYGITIAQTAIAFVSSKGIVPISGCRKPYQVKQLAEAASITLKPDEIARLEAAADETGIKVLGSDMFRFAVRW